jgi:hypothetical protein
MLRDFTVIYDGEEYRVARALDAQDAARMASQRIYSDSAGEAFDVTGGKPTRVEVRDDAGEVTAWDVHIDFAPTFFAYPTQGTDRG